MVEVPVDLNSLMHGNKVRASRRRVPETVSVGDHVIANDEADIDAHYSAEVLEVAEKSLTLLIDLSGRSVPQKAA